MVVTFTLALTTVDVPPEPVHDMEYVVLVVGLTVCVPEVALVPVQPPDAVHDVALVEDHERVAD